MARYADARNDHLVQQLARMTANELYARTPVAIYKNLDFSGCYYNHVPEIDYLTWDGEVEQDRVEERVLLDHSFDGRRIWRLATIWFDNKPVMVIQNAGREGDDHAERFVTDPDLYREMVSYINSIIPVPKPHDVIRADEDLPELTDFYSHQLDGHFEHWRY